jgi:RHS repeat-associated protein
MTQVLTPDSGTVNYTYDGAGRKLSDGNGTFTYDGAGHVATASNNNGTYAFAYDHDGRLTQVTEPFSLTLNYSYDNAGNQTQVTDSQNGTTVSTYDSDNFLTRRTYQGQSQTFRVDFANNKEGWNTTLARYSDLAGTTLVATTNSSYDSVGQVTSVLSTDKNGATINKFVYSPDSADRLTSETDTQNGATTTTAYSYDSNGQITAAGGDSYAYDNNGNITGGSYGVTTGNQMSADANWTYSYDKEGNLKEKDTKTGGSSEKWTYTYNPSNELTEANHYTSAGTLDLNVDYKYDAFGEQIEEDVNGTAFAKFGIDGWNSNMARPTGHENMKVWARLDVTSSLINRYLWGDRVDQQLGRVDLGPATPYWTLQDRLGSIRDVIDNNGAVKDDVQYDAFGGMSSETASSYRGWYAYTGRECDTETNLQYNHARWYDAAMCRWISHDPLGFDAGDSNLYRYVKNSPTNATDPSGLQELTEDQLQLLAEFAESNVEIKEKRQIMKDASARILELLPDIRTTAATYHDLVMQKKDFSQVQDDLENQISEVTQYAADVEDAANWIFVERQGRSIAAMAILPDYYVIRELKGYERDADFATRKYTALKGAARGVAHEIYFRYGEDIAMLSDEQLEVNFEAGTQFQPNGAYTDIILDIWDAYAGFRDQAVGWKGVRDEVAEELEEAEMDFVADSSCSSDNSPGGVNMGVCLDSSSSSHNRVGVHGVA